MEQRLDASYLQHDPIERAAATALVAAGLGVGVLLAGWGISLLWRYTPPEIAVRVANPEVQLAQSAPLVVKQESPFVMATPSPLKVEQGQLSVKVEQVPTFPVQTVNAEVIHREVTIFSHVQHGPGTVLTGWNYKDGRGGTPVSQFCYYTSQNSDRTSKRVDLATDGVRLSQANLEIVPDLEGALTKCQWWRG
jgi:hypothetical protein